MARASIAAIAIALAMAQWGSSAAAQDSRAAEAHATIAFLEGEVLVDGESADIGQRLPGRFKVETGREASCDIVFDDKNALHIAKNTVAVLDLTGLRKEASLERGGITAVMRKLAKIADKDSFQVLTRAAVLGVRGTSFCVWADPLSASTYVCACNGEVWTIDAEGSNQLDLKSAHHLGRLYSKAESGITVSPAGVEHHDDGTVESLAARIGERIDWTSADD
jgi:Uncharacterized protein conserved in bacteria